MQALIQARIDNAGIGDDKLPQDHPGSVYLHYTHLYCLCMQARHSHA